MDFIEYVRLAGRKSGITIHVTMSMMNVVGGALQSVVVVNYNIVSGLFACFGYTVRLAATVVAILLYAVVDVFGHLLQLVKEVTVFCLTGLRLLYSVLLFVGHLTSLLVGCVEAVASWSANVLPSAMRVTGSVITESKIQLAVMFESLLHVLCGVGLWLKDACATIVNPIWEILAQVARETCTNIAALTGVSVLAIPLERIRSSILHVVDYTRSHVINSIRLPRSQLVFEILLLLIILSTLLLMVRKLIHSRKLQDFMFPNFLNNVEMRIPIDDTFDASDDELAVDQPHVFNYDAPTDTDTESGTEFDIDEFDVSDINSTDFSTTTDDEFWDENDENDHHSVNIQLPEPQSRARTPSILSKLGDKTNIVDVGRIIESERDKRLCVICQDQEKSVLILPCKHMCLCVNCAHSIASSRARMRRTCPLCRVPFHTVMNVYV